MASTSNEKLWHKIDSFFWSSSLISREDKKTQHIRGHRLVNDTCLLITRVIMLLLVLAVLIEDLIELHKRGKLTPKYFCFMTNLSLILTIVYFTLVVASSTLCLKKPNLCDRSDSSPWHLWKWSVTILTIDLNI